MQKNLLFPLMSCLLLLTTLLSACGSSSTASSVTPSASATLAQVSTPKTSPANPTTVSVTPTIVPPTAIPTSSSCNVTYGCGVGSSNLTPYHGNSYTINYPGSWVIKSDDSNGNVFSSPDGTASLHVFVQDSSTLTDPLRYEFGTLAKDNCKALPDGMQTIQIAGIAWQQSLYSCLPADGGQAGGTVKQIGILISTDLHNNKYYSMDYITSPNNFNNTYQIFFQPMTTSFKLQ